MARKDSLSGQRYACDRPGCDKHYSRPDHLLRHKLNHDREKVLACDQCDRTFVRQDLLARHLERHALRGKTLGRWSGKRKQSDSGDGQDDDEGSDVNDGELMYDSSMASMHQTEIHPSMRTQTAQKLSALDRYERPFAYAPPAAAPAAQGYGFREVNNGSMSGQYQTADGLSSGASAGPSSLGPPMPYDMLEHRTQHHAQGRQYEDSRPSPSRVGRSAWDALPTASHGPQYGSGPLVDLPSLSSTGQDTVGGGTAGAWDGAYMHANTPMAMHQTSDGPSLSTSGFAQPGGDGIHAGLPEATALLHSAVSGSSHFPFSAPTTSDYVADYDWLFDGTNPLGPKAADEMASTVSESSTNREWQATDDGHDQGGEDRQSEDLPHASQEGEQADALHDLAFFAILQRDIPDEPAFDVDGDAHGRLLHFLSSVQELSTSPLFTPSALRCYLYLFFTKLNAIYPLIHRPTFSAKTADPMLLSAMIVCGAHFADEAAHFLAERIGRKLWGALISFEDFRPARATLALLQAMLLTETFGKMMGTRPQHETAHLFHNFIVTLARRNAVFVPTKVKLPQAQQERWRAWSREEEKKRISLFSFILDAQHATIFRHIPALSSFQIHLHLPCDEDEWEARSAQDWAAVRQNKRGEPPYFIAALKASLTPEHAPPIAESDSFKHLVLLHGIMSVAYDLQWKQQALLAAPDTSESISNWKEKLMVTYRACMHRLHSLPAPPRIVDRASYSLTEWAQIVLHADPVDIQIYAGLPTVMGRFIDHHTFSVARKSCREWAKTEDARIAVWHAARFLHTALFPDVIGQGDRPLHTGFDELLHHQWVQYLCALVIWAYQQAFLPLKTHLPSRPSSQDQDSNASSLAATSLQHATPTHSLTAQPVPNFATPLSKTINEANASLSHIVASDTGQPSTFHSPLTCSTAVLELVERDCRGSRWELGREASGVLRKLIRERSTT